MVSLGTPLDMLTVSLGAPLENILMNRMYECNII